MILHKSSIEALTLDELVGLDGTSVSEFFRKTQNEPLDYGWIEGSDVFKQEVASLYQNRQSGKASYKRMERLVLIFLALYALVGSRRPCCFDASYLSAII